MDDMCIFQSHVRKRLRSCEAQFAMHLIFAPMTKGTRHQNVRGNERKYHLPVYGQVHHYRSASHEY